MTFRFGSLILLQMKVLKIILFIFLAILVQRFCHDKTDGFALRKIISDLPFAPAWEVAEPEESSLAEIKKILSQPYRYLGKGAQSYVFASLDGLYVLKFFRHDHMRREPWHLLLSGERRKEREVMAYDKLAKDFTSYKLAFEHLKEETGLVYLHLNKTNHLQIEIPLYDKIGVRHALQLDHMEFVLQKRATLLFPALERWIDAGQASAAKKALSALVHFLKTRCEKEIFDKDPDLNTNFGFLETCPMQIDIGRFKIDGFYSNKQVYKREIRRITDNLQQWLELRSPELSVHLQKELEKL